MTLFFDHVFPPSKLFAPTILFFLLMRKSSQTAYSSPLSLEARETKASLATPETSFILRPFPHCSSFLFLTKLYMFPVLSAAAIINLSFVIAICGPLPPPVESCGNTTARTGAEKFFPLLFEEENKIVSPEAYTRYTLVSSAANDGAAPLYLLP